MLSFNESNGIPFLGERRSVMVASNTDEIEILMLALSGDT